MDYQFRSRKPISITIFITVLVTTWMRLDVVFAQNWLVDQIIPADYDPDEPPRRSDVDNGVVWIDGHMVLNHFHASKSQMSLHTDMTLCLKWNDYRLLNPNPVTASPAIGETNKTESDSRDDSNSSPESSSQSPSSSSPSPVTLGRYPLIRTTNISRFWVPVIYFRNSLDVSLIESLQMMQYIEVEPDTQTVRYCRRLNSQFTCHFRLSNFPFDVQNCFFRLESFGNSRQNIRLRLSYQTWTGGNFQLELHHMWNGTCESDSPLNPFADEPSRYLETCAYVGVRLVRHLNYYVIRYYCPTFLCVATSCCGYWVATNGWPGRVICTCVVYLTIKPVSETAYDEVPSHDVVSLFWWLWGIQFFIYMNLVEYTWALAWVQFAEDKKRARIAGVVSPDGRYFGKKSWYAWFGAFTDKVLFRFYGPIDMQRDPANRNKIDNCAKLFTPAVIFIFVFTYIVATIPEWAGHYNGVDLPH